MCNSIHILIYLLVLYRSYIYLSCVYPSYYIRPYSRSLLRSTISCSCELLYYLTVYRVCRVCSHVCERVSVCACARVSVWVSVFACMHACVHVCVYYLSVYTCNDVQPPMCKKTLHDHMTLPVRTSCPQTTGWPPSAEGTPSWCAGRAGRTPSSDWSVLSSGRRCTPRASESSTGSLQQGAAHATIVM